jgi:hypothetical protein
MESYRVSNQVKKPPVCEAAKGPYKNCKKAKKKKKEVNTVVCLDIYMPFNCIYKVLYFLEYSMPLNKSRTQFFKKHLH